MDGSSISNSFSHCRSFASTFLAELKNITTKDRADNYKEENFDKLFDKFDDDKNGTIEFKEFILALAVTQLQSERDKLSWAFRLYDIDGGGTINVTEMQQIIETLDQIEGRAVNAIDTTGKNILINQIGFF